MVFTCRFLISTKIVYPLLPLLRLASPPAFVVEMTSLLSLSNVAVMVEVKVFFRNIGN
jgi:hypothetical protein